MKIFRPALFVLLPLLLASRLNAQNFTLQLPPYVELNCNTFCDTLVPVVTPIIQCEWLWNNNATTQGLLICQPGQYTVTATNSQGQTATATVVVGLNFNIPAPFILSSNSNYCSNANGCERVCPGATVTYEAEASGSGFFYFQWQISGASHYTVSNDQRSVQVTWGQQGAGTVTLTAIEGQSECTGTTSLCVLVVDEPDADISTLPAAVNDTIQVCEGQAVWFSGLGSAAADTYEWLFSDDLSSNNNPELDHTFQTAGLYEVQLIARSACLCADTARVWINVRPAIAPQLECYGTVCSGETVSYRVSPACPDLVWSVQNGLVLGNGGDSLTVQWQSGPAGIITLSGIDCAGNTCPGPVYFRIPVLDDLAEIEGPEKVCINSLSTYSIETYGGTGYSWSLSGGGTIVAGQGTPKVEIEWGASLSATPHRLIVTYDNCYLGCQGRDTIWINLLSPFTISGPAERCAGATGNYTARRTANNQLIACHWTLYDPDDAVVWTSSAPAANPVIPFGAVAGWYRIAAVPSDATLSCDDQAFWRVRVAALPATPAGIDGETLVCPGTPLSYEAPGLPADGSVRWMRTSGAGPGVVLTGNPVNITWTANTPHSLSVWQVSTDGLNCASPQFTLPVSLVGPLPVNGPSPVCEGSVATYTATPVGSLDYQWSLLPADAGAVKTAQGKHTIEIFWQKPGNHQLVLNVCGHVTQLPVTVLALPEPVVTHPAGLCPGTTGTVQTTLPFSAYQWETALGSPLGQNAMPALAAGQYALTVTDANGCEGNTFFDIAEYPEPNLTVTTTDPTGFCNNSRYVTIDALTTADGDYVYDWFRDGISLNHHAPSLTTNQYGYYSAEVSNQFGCKAADGPVQVFEFCGGVCHNPNHPVICPAGSVNMAITAGTACDSFGFQLIAGANYAPGTANWVFGESGANSLGQLTGDQVSFEFPNAGQYLVVLYALLQNGAQCVVVDSVKVEAAAKFTPELACAGASSQFADVSTFLPESGLTHWQWDFGDPASGPANTSTLRNTSHDFTAGGLYPVRLTVTANSGCTSTATQPAFVPTGTPLTPQAITPGCVDVAVAFDATGVTGISRYAWDFGDPASAAANQAEGAAVYHKYASATSYTISLTTTNTFGCTSTETTTVGLWPNTLSGLIVPPNPAPICAGQTLTLQAPAGGDAYLWSDLSTVSQALTVGATGTYDVTLTDNKGCTYSPPPSSVQVRPIPNGLISALLFNEYGQEVGTATQSLVTCYGEDVNLEVQGFGLSSYSYYWSTNVYGSAIDFTEDRGNLLSVGTYNFTVTITDQSTGCTAVTAPFQVIVNPAPSQVGIGSSSACATAPVSLFLLNPAAPDWTFLWNTGETTASISTEYPGRYTVKVTNSYGCSLRSNEVVLNPGPNVDAIPSGCHTRCRPDSLCLPALPNILSWQWYQDGVPVPGATSGQFVAQQSGTYWAELTDIWGCTAQSDPLTLDLYDGYGHVLGQVWHDLNQNGAIDAADTLISGIDVQLWQNGILGELAQTNANGQVAFADVAAGNYTAQLDLSTLPAGWSAVIDQQAVSLAGCDNQAPCALLVAFSCAPQHSSVQLDACAGGSATYNGTALAAGSSQIFSFTTTSGCDSMVTVSVSSLAASAAQLDVSVCFGESYDYNGTAIPAGTSQQFTLTNAAGCDSVLTVTVAELPPLASAMQVSLCPGEGFSYEGTILQGGDTQTFTLTSVMGCDSAVTVTALALSASFETLAFEVCPGETYPFDGVDLAGGETRIFSYTNAAGCDSVVSVSVAELPPTDFDLTASPACPDAPTGSLTASGVSGGAGPYLYALDSGAFQAAAAFDQLPAGTYAVWVENADGCRFRKETEVPAREPLSAILPPAVLPCDSSGILLAPVVAGDSTGLAYLWSSGETSPALQVSDPGPVWVEVTNVCATVRAEGAANWTAPDGSAQYIYTPNIFSPDARDARNASFRPVLAAGLLVLDYQFDVYDRWGTRLFATADPVDSWAGPFRGSDMQPGVYVWTVSARVAFCGREFDLREKGDVLLLR